MSIRKKSKKKIIKVIGEGFQNSSIGARTKYNNQMNCFLCSESMIDNTKRNKWCKRCNIQYYHDKCIKQWIDSGNHFCPYCKTSIDLDCIISNKELNQDSRNISEV